MCWEDWGEPLGKIATPGKSTPATMPCVKNSHQTSNQILSAPKQLLTKKNKKLFSIVILIQTSLFVQLPKAYENVGCIYFSNLSCSRNLLHEPTFDLENPNFCSHLMPGSKDTNECATLRSTKFKWHYNFKQIAMTLSEGFFADNGDVIVAATSLWSCKSSQTTTNIVSLRTFLNFRTCFALFASICTCSKSMVFLVVLPWR